MFFELALAAHMYTVQPGDTLSGIAASHGVSLAAVESANPQIRDFDLIYVGDHVSLPGSGQEAAASPPVYHHHTVSPAATGGGGGGYSSSDLASIPGVPRSFAACVAFRESTNGTNQAYNGGVYGIINASGEHVNGQSLAAQKAAFARLYQRYGKSPWTPSDGC